MEIRILTGTATLLRLLRRTTILMDCSHHRRLATSTHQIHFLRSPFRRSIAIPVTYSTPCRPSLPLLLLLILMIPITITIRTPSHTLTPFPTISTIHPPTPIPLPRVFINTEVSPPVIHRMLTLSLLPLLLPLLPTP